MSFKSDAEKSIAAFEQFTEPAIKAALDDVIVVRNFERHDSELATLLDYNGVDAMAITADGEIYPVASRIQFGKNFAAFSIRRSRPNGAMTEYQKLQQTALPTYHIQTFVLSNNGGAVVGITRTKNLLKYIHRHKEQWRRTTDGETFYFAPFADVAARVFFVTAGQVFEKQKAAR